MRLAADSVQEALFQVEDSLDGEFEQAHQPDGIGLAQDSLQADWAYVTAAEDGFPSAASPEAVVAYLKAVLQQ